MPSAAAAAMQAAARSSHAARKRATSRTARNATLEALKNDDGDQLASEVSQEEAEGLFTYLQTQAATFHRFDASSLQRLVSFFSVLKYDKSQTLVERGEPGTWFGVVLNGVVNIILPNGSTVPLTAGAVLGEMVTWDEHSRRGATMKGGSAGLLAIMLRSDVPKLLALEPQIGRQVLSMLGQSALVKQIDNARRAREGMHKGRQISWIDDPAASDAGTRIRGDLAAMLMKRGGFEEDEAEAIAEMAKVVQIKGPPAALIGTGQSTNTVLLVVHGSLILDRFNLEVGEGGQVGSTDAAKTPRPCVSLRVPACPCVSLRASACPCVSLRASACPCVSLRAQSPIHALAAHAETRPRLLTSRGGRGSVCVPHGALHMGDTGTEPRRMAPPWDAGVKPRATVTRMAAHTHDCAHARLRTRMAAHTHGCAHIWRFLQAGTPSPPIMSTHAVHPCCPPMLFRSGASSNTLASVTSPTRPRCPPSRVRTRSPGRRASCSPVSATTSFGR